MVDLDDTLVPSGGEMLSDSAREWLLSMREAGFPVLILSNGTRLRVDRWKAELELPGFHLVGKPFWFAYRRGLRMLGTKAEETLMVGDQIFTDVLGANLAGVTSVLVEPLSVGTLVHTRLLRKVEQRILKGGHGESLNR